MITSTNSIIKKLLVLFLVFGGLHYAKSFLMPLFIAIVLATLFLPFCKWIEAKKVPKGFAALTSLLILLVVIAGLFAMIGWQIAELTNDFALVKQKFMETANRIQEYIFNKFGISADTQSQILIDESRSFSGIIQMFVGSMAYIFTNFIIILAYIFGMLYYRNHIKNFLLKLSLPAQRKEMEHVIYRATYVSQQYLLGLTKMIGCLWIMYSIGFSIVGIKNPFLFAILCGMLEIVPFIGNITGTTLTLLVAAVHGAELPVLGGIVVTYGLIQFIQGWVLEPLILGPQVKINPFATIVALVMGELIWGIPGIVLAIPLTAMFKIVCDHIESLKPYGFLIGEIVTRSGEDVFKNKIRRWFKKEKP